MNRSVIPAEPGWFAIEPSYSEDGKTVESVFLSPIVAWIIEIDARKNGDVYAIYPIAITVDGSFEGPLLSPAGSVHLQTEQDWLNMDDFCNSPPSRWNVAGRLPIQKSGFGRDGSH